MRPATPDRLRLAELVAALSLATDLGMGQPMAHALRTCLFAIALGRALGFHTETVSRTRSRERWPQRTARRGCSRSARTCGIAGHRAPGPICARGSCTVTWTRSAG